MEANTDANLEANLAAVHEAVAAAVPERECIVWRDRRLTYAQVTERSRRLANALLARGLGHHRSRATLAGHESGQDHLAIVATNGNEYLEAMLGAFKARVAPCNVNYRYVADELRFVLRDARARAVVVASTFAPVLDAVRDDLPDLEVLIQIDDGSGAPLLDGAQWYEDVLAGAPAERPDVTWDPDDLYVLYTGGTTGAPRGVLWRQADIFVAAMGGRDPDTGGEWASLGALAAAAAARSPTRVLPTAPFMHGAGHWMAFNAFAAGSTVCIQDHPGELDPADVWATVARERVETLLVVGDAFGRPLVEYLETAGADAPDVSSVVMVASGGAPLHPVIKDRFAEALPGALVLDAVGASETGSQLSTVTTPGRAARRGPFTAGPGVEVLDEARGEVLAAGHRGVGWLAQRGRVPLGYLGDPGRSALAFPVIDGERYALSGDRARRCDDGDVELLGRDSVTINTGGEKVFAEEVEAALARHPAVYDVVVAGRASQRWGEEVVAIVQLRPGATADLGELRAVAGERIARYKLPKAVRFVARVERSPAGKADYRWAREAARLA